MEEKCLECSKWAESMYWSHFECMQFCQILDGDFHTQLMIPKKFSENARGKLQDTVILKGPSGTGTWHVKLAAIDDALFLKDGWQEFLKSFTVERNDILIFKYTGNSCFRVLIFDRQSLCEKESSYFIRKCGHSELGITGHDKKIVNKSFEDVTQDNSDEDIELIPPKKQKGEMYQEKAVAFEEQVTLAATIVTEPKAQCEPILPKNHKGETYKTKVVSFEERVTFASADATELKAPYAHVGAARERPRTRSWGWEPVKLPPAVAEKPKLAKKEPNPDYVTYISRRRPVTEEEKEKALLMAKEELTQDCFLVVMRPTHVYKKFFLTMPSEWIHKSLMIYEKQTIRLRVNGKTWVTRLIFSSRRRGGLSYGWKEFALGNCLEEFDVLVFKLASQAHEPVLLDVTIFRVVPETINSIRVSPTSTKN